MSTRSLLTRSLTKSKNGFGPQTKNSLRGRGSSISSTAIATASTSATTAASFELFAEDNRLFDSLSYLVVLGGGGVGENLKNYRSSSGRVVFAEGKSEPTQKTGRLPVCLGSRNPMGRGIWRTILPLLP